MSQLIYNVNKESFELYNHVLGICLDVNGLKGMRKSCPSCLASLKHLQFIVCGLQGRQVWPPVLCLDEK